MSGYTDKKPIPAGNCTSCGAEWDDCHENMNRLADALEAVYEIIVGAGNAPGVKLAAIDKAHVALRLAGRIP